MGRTPFLSNQNQIVLQECRRFAGRRGIVFNKGCTSHSPKRRREGRQQGETRRGRFRKGDKEDDKQRARPSNPALVLLQNRRQEGSQRGGEKNKGTSVIRFNSGNKRGERSKFGNLWVEGSAVSMVDVLLLNMRLEKLGAWS